MLEGEIKFRWRNNIIDNLKYHILRPYRGLTSFVIWTIYEFHKYCICTKINADLSILDSTWICARIQSSCVSIESLKATQPSEQHTHRISQIVRPKLPNNKNNCQAHGTVKPSYAPQFRLYFWYFSKRAIPFIA